MKVTVSIGNINSKVTTVMMLHVPNRNFMRSKKYQVYERKKLLESR